MDEKKISMETEAKINARNVRSTEISDYWMSLSIAIIKEKAYVFMYYEISTLFTTFLAYVASAIHLRLTI